jgi:hypothetical protein
VKPVHAATMSNKSAIVTTVTASVTLELELHALRLEHKAAVDDIADGRGSFVDLFPASVRVVTRHPLGNDNRTLPKILFVHHAFMIADKGHNA